MSSNKYIARLETLKYGVLYIVDDFSFGIAIQILEEIAGQEGWKKK
jgi:hypothetical protein